MAITYNIANAYTGTRTTSTPDPDNEGETIETTADVIDVEVTFTDDSYTPNKTHTRMVNVCFDSNGDYDHTETVARIEQVKSGFERKVSVNAIIISWLDVDQAEPHQHHGEEQRSEQASGPKQ